jgi:hypothetical protein
MADMPFWQLDTDDVQPGRENVYDYWFGYTRPLDAGLYAG